jgi:hypothetical protein
MELVHLNKALLLLLKKDKVNKNYYVASVFVS